MPAKKTRVAKLVEATLPPNAAEVMEGNREALARISQDKGEIVPPKKVKRKQQNLNISTLGSLTYMVDKLANDQAEAMIFISVYVNSRPRSEDTIALAQAIEFFAQCTPQEKAYLTYEILCNKFEIDYSTFIAALSGGAYLANVPLAQAQAAKEIGVTIGAMTDRASDEKAGYNDRKMHLQMLGMLQPEGSAIVNVGINNNVSTTVNNLTAAMPELQKAVISTDDLMRRIYDEAYVESSQGNTNVIDVEVEEV